MTTREENRNKSYSLVEVEDYVGKILVLSNLEAFSHLDTIAIWIHTIIYTSRYILSTYHFIVCETTSFHSIS